MIVWLPVILSGTLTLGPTTPAASPAPAVNDVSVPYGAMLNDSFRRVRAADNHVKRLLEEGLKRSVTFGDLVAAVNASDVIVYIERVDRLGPTRRTNKVTPCATSERPMSSPSATAGPSSCSSSASARRTA